MACLRLISTAFTRAAVSAARRASPSCASAAAARASEPEAAATAAASVAAARARSEDASASAFVSARVSASACRPGAESRASQSRKPAFGWKNTRRTGDEPPARGQLAGAPCLRGAEAQSSRLLLHRLCSRLFLLRRCLRTGQGALQAPQLTGRSGRLPCAACALLCCGRLRKLQGGVGCRRVGSQAQASDATTEAGGRTRGRLQGSVHGAALPPRERRRRRAPQRALSPP